MTDNKSNLFSISSGGGFVLSVDFARPVSQKKKKLYIRLKPHHLNSHYYLRCTCSTHTQVKGMVRLKESLLAEISPENKDLG